MKVAALGHVEISEENAGIGSAIGKRDRAGKRNRIIQRQSANIIGVIGMKRIDGFGAPECAADFAFPFARMISCRKSEIMFGMKIAIDESKVVSRAFPTRVFRKIDLLSVDYQIAQVNLLRATGELEVEDAKAIHFHRLTAMLDVEKHPRWAVDRRSGR